MTLWVIGFMFTVGYTGWLKAKLPWWKSFGVLLAILAVWPMFLGMEFGGCFEDGEAANKKNRGVCPKGVEDAKQY